MCYEIDRETSERMSDDDVVRLQSIRNDLYVLTHDNRQTSTFTMDRFDFDKGLTTIRYLDDFFRQSSYADRVLGEEAALSSNSDMRT